MKTVKKSLRRNVAQFGRIPAENAWGLKNTSANLEITPAHATLLATLLQQAAAECYSYDRRTRAAKAALVQVGLEWGSGPHMRIFRRLSLARRGA